MNLITGRGISNELQSPFPVIGPLAEETLLFSEKATALQQSLKIIRDLNQNTFVR